MMKTATPRCGTSMPYYDGEFVISFAAGRATAINRPSPRAAPINGTVP